jgi:hypothetical protein
VRRDISGGRDFSRLAEKALYHLPTLKRHRPYGQWRRNQLHEVAKIVQPHSPQFHLNTKTTLAWRSRNGRPACEGNGLPDLMFFG